MSEDLHKGQRYYQSIQRINGHRDDIENAIKYKNSEVRVAFFLVPRCCGVVLTGQSADV